jgi:hypothetical protein
VGRQKNRDEVAFLAHLAGITVPEGRLDALVAGVRGTEAICDALARLPLGAAEPACRFEPPPSR